MRDSATPPGWSYNPSAWSERLPLLILALLGFGISLYLALFQFGVLANVWDPFFGSASSRAVLHSVVERYLPVPDASLGALGYTADVVTGGLGGRDRWRAMPWIVLLFGATIAALGAVSTLLIIIQGTVVRQWCTLCLCSAAISIIILGIGFGETLAALQQVKREHTQGRSLWHALLGGGEHGAVRQQPATG